MTFCSRNSIILDQEIFVAQKIFADLFQRQKLNWQNIFPTYKWSKFILSSGHSDENKARQKFNHRNILPPKNSRSTVYMYVQVQCKNQQGI